MAPYYVEAWRRASVNTLEKIECSLRKSLDLNMSLLMSFCSPHITYQISNSVPYADFSLEVVKLSACIVGAYPQEASFN